MARGARATPPGPRPAGCSPRRASTWTARGRGRRARRHRRRHPRRPPRLRAGGHHRRHGPGGARRDARGHARRVLDREAPGIAELLRAHGPEADAAGRRWPAAGRACGDVPGREPARQPRSGARRAGGARAAPAPRAFAARRADRARADGQSRHETKKEDGGKGRGQKATKVDKTAKGVAAVGYIKSQGTRKFRKSRSGGTAQIDRRDGLKRPAGRRDKAHGWRVRSCATRA